MSREDYCDRHTWASVGVVARHDGVGRIWECENCPVWTTETFDRAHEQAWDDTWLAER
ncbi:hypothetical protein ACFQJ5_14615 [Halomicroarcula sp. GCM10025324]|jgi:hypothetical protein|uniref:hypothetical protein n=1 Tax=Haloarcula TaxID=2237 RepID=UPI0023E86401|nr:hypothetical protein [Halomicroarcula sp. ZS-22-S1]